MMVVGLHGSKFASPGKGMRGRPEYKLPFRSKKSLILTEAPMTMTRVEDLVAKIQHGMNATAPRTRDPRCVRIGDFAT